MPTTTLRIQIDSKGAQLNVQELEGALKDVGVQAKVTEENLDKAGKAGSEMAKNVKTAAAVAAVIALGKAAYDLSNSFDNARQAMAAITGSSERASAALGFVRDIALTTGQDIIFLTEQFTLLTAATEGSNVTSAQTERLFTAVTTAGKVLGLSNEKLAGTLDVLGDAAAKGTVTLQDLNRINNTLPGGLDAVARSLGVSNEELRSMAKEGDLIASDVLPRLAEELERTFADKLPETLASAETAFGRLRNELKLVLAGVGDVLNELSGPLANKAANFLQVFVERAQALDLALKAPDTSAWDRYTGVFLKQNELVDKGIMLQETAATQARQIAKEKEKQAADDRKAREAAKTDFEKLSEARQKELLQLRERAAVAGAVSQEAAMRAKLETEGYKDLSAAQKELFLAAARAADAGKAAETGRKEAASAAKKDAEDALKIAQEQYELGVKEANEKSKQSADREQRIQDDFEKVVESVEDPVTKASRIAREKIDILNENYRNIAVITDEQETAYTQQLLAVEAERNAAIQAVRDQYTNDAIAKEEAANALRVANSQFIYNVLLSNLQTLGTKSRVMLQAAFIAEKAYAVASIIMNTEKAAALAQATIPPPAGQILAGVIKVSGYASAALVAAMAVGQVGSVGKKSSSASAAGGGAGAGGGGGGSLSTLNDDDKRSKLQSISVTLVGKSFDREDVMTLVEQLNELQQDRGNLQFTASR